MTRSLALKKFVLIGIGALVAVALSAVMDQAVSAHGGDPSLIHACVNPGGQVRVVGANDSCKQNEAAVDLSQAGSQGSGLPSPDFDSGFVLKPPSGPLRLTPAFRTPS